MINISNKIIIKDLFGNEIKTNFFYLPFDVLKKHIKYEISDSIITIKSDNELTIEEIDFCVEYFHTKRNFILFNNKGKLINIICI